MTIAGIGTRARSLALIAMLCGHAVAMAQAVPTIDCKAFANKAVRGEWMSGRSVDMPFESVVQDGNQCQVVGTYKYGPNSRGSAGGSMPFRGTITPMEIAVELSATTGAVFRIDGETLKGVWRDSKTGEAIHGRNDFRLTAR